MADMRKAQQKLVLWRFLIWILLAAAIGRTAYLVSVSLINFVFNEGSLIVPDLAGIQLQQASSILAPYELSVIQSGEKYHSFMQKGEIVSQDPFPGIKVKKGRIVKVIVSAGQENIRVPEVRKKILVEAESMIRNQGFTVREKCYTENETVLKDHVIAVHPEPGIMIPRGAGVDLLLSSGSGKKDILVPDLKGKKYLEVKNESSLKIFPHYEYIPEEEQGIILRQTPAPSTVMKSDAVIDVWINEPVIPVRGARHFETVSYDVPRGHSSSLMRIIVTDEQGIREAFRQEVTGGENISCTIGGVGKMRVIIYLDSVIVRESDL